MLSVAEAITGSRLKAKVLNWLYVEAGAATRINERALARQVDIPAGSIHKVLISLVKDQLVVREETSRGPEYRAPFDDPRFDSLIAFFRQESEIVAVLKKALKSFKNIEYACIFGSFARGTTHKASDVDVLVLESSEENRFQIMSALSRVSDKIKREANPQFYSVEEFRKLAQDGETVAMSILSGQRITLKGQLPWQV
jgi:predicted nucleotidyltransferase